MLKGSKEYMPTYTLIAINVIVYVWTALLSQNFIIISDNVLVQYGQLNSSVFNGAYWQLFTAMFVHVSIIHIAGNMLFLLIFGLRAEEMFNIEEYLAIYLLSGLTGNVLTLLYGFNMLSAGASGAIFGMFGAVIIYAKRSMNQSIATALMYAAIMLMLNASAEVNILAHLGGLIVGLLLGYSVAATRRKATVYKYRYSYASR
jgi:rhomboid protease GluP